MAQKPKPDHKAERQKAIATLRQKNGRISMMTIAELITDETGPPTPQMAGWFADAITQKWGSWAAFDKDRKTYNAERAEQQQRLTKAIFDK